MSQCDGPLEDTRCVDGAWTHSTPVSQRVMWEGSGVGFCVSVGGVASGVLEPSFERGTRDAAGVVCTWKWRGIWDISGLVVLAGAGGMCVAYN
ncbi:hypothetical protein TSMEX_008652 [Taenia solium]|eukprot:TsM_000455700 transcript=TsM_000455700 gene=TsM_000455700